MIVSNFSQIIKEQLGHLPQDDYPVLDTFKFTSKGLPEQAFGFSEMSNEYAILHSAIFSSKIPENSVERSQFYG